MDKGESEKVSNSLPISLDLPSWTKLYNDMHDRFVSGLALAQNDLNTLPENSNAYRRATWHFETMTEFYRFLEVTNLIVKKLAEDQPLLDFVKLLRNAHESEERTREALR